MEIQSGHSEMSIISQVSAVEGCPLSGVPLYLAYQGSARDTLNGGSASAELLSNCMKYGISAFVFSVSGGCGKHS